MYLLPTASSAECTVSSRGTKGHAKGDCHIRSYIKKLIPGIAQALSSQSIHRQ